MVLKQRSNGIDLLYANPMLTFIDTILAGIIIGPFSVAFWRGTWQLSDIYVFPNNELHSALVSLAVGYSGRVLYVFLQWRLMELEKNQKPAVVFLMHCLYSYFGGILFINHWRGVWKLIDYITGTTKTSAVVCVGIGHVFLWFLRGTKLILVPPFIICPDADPNFFKYTTRFRTQPLKTLSGGTKYVLDTIFTTFVMTGLVITYRRGLWTVFYHIIFSGETLQSGLLCLAIAYGIFIITSLLQFLADKAFRDIKNDKCSNFKRILLGGSFYAVVVFGGAAYFSGFWMVYNKVILPDNYAASNWLTHLVGIFALTLMRCANSNMDKGCPIVGDEDSAVGMFLPNFFVRMFMFNIQKDYSYDIQASYNKIKVEKDENENEIDKTTIYVIRL